MRQPRKFFTTKYLFLFSLFFVLLLACSKDDDVVKPVKEEKENQEEVEEEENPVALKQITISSSTDTIAANGIDKVEFEVKVFDADENQVKDVDYVLLLNGEPLNIHSFKTEEQGDFHIKAQIEDLVSNELIVKAVHPNNLVKSLRIKTNTSLILNDDTSFATVEVQALNENKRQVQGAQYELTANQQVLEDNTAFKTSEAGEYHLKARIGDLESNEITVEARENITYEELSVPVIFHVVHFGEQKGSGNNLSAAVIHEQLNRLNKGFANQYDSGNPNSVDTFIRFRLAQLDEEDNLLEEPGIHRMNGSIYDKGSDNKQAKSKRPWPIDERHINATPTNSISAGDIPNDQKLGKSESYAMGRETMWDMNKYLNIYIFPFENGHQTVGYAYLPMVWDSHPLDGLQDLPRQNESNLNLRYEQNCLDTKNIQRSESTTIIHEVGHNLGLLHTFSTDDCATSDYCSDTFSYVKDLTSVSCNDNLGSLDNDNFMDYVGTSNTFTFEQRERMRHVFEYGFFYNQLKYSQK